ncbi:LCP family protein [Candidatus Woesebacteria bacterium]|nr:LCP family protein [Candidatus Woesebacteria bacterium]
MKKLLKIILQILPLFLIAIAVFLVSLLSTYFILKLSGYGKKEIVNNNKQKVFVQEENEYSNNFSVLLLGYGGAGHPGGTLSDVMMLVYVDVDDQKIFLISVPRDTWVDLPVQSDKSEYHKINFAHAIGVDDTRYPLKQAEFKGENGGGELAKIAVEKVTGILPDFYIGVDFSSFEAAIDELDGITVDVPVSFTDRFYPVKGLENEPCGKSPEEIAQLTNELSGFELEKQFECRYEVLEFNSGENKMNGVTALKFVRSRHSEQHGGDFARSQRQQAVLDAVKDRLLTLEALDDIPDFYQRFNEMLSTDLTISAITEISKALGNPYNYELVDVRISDENVLMNSRSNDGQFILIPKAGVGNWDEIHMFVEENLGLNEPDQ